ncbi:MAG: glycosyltransferase [Planctomycetaceae bacterium]|nr:glycosyltransferase [Planctomycetaceae bacterium]
MIQAVRKTIHDIPQTDDRPTICHVIHALGVGGAEVLVNNMVRCLSDEFRCIVAVLDEIGQIGDQLIRDGIIVEHLHRQPGIDRGCARRLKAFADKHGAAILHAHQYTPFFQSVLSRGLTGTRPVVFTEHGRHFPDIPSRKRSLVNRLLLRKHDRLFGVGEATRQALIDNEGLPASRVETIYNGVDLEAMRILDPGARSAVRKEFGIGKDDFLIVQIARLHELKDHQTALKVMDVVRRRQPTAKLLIVGDGEQRAAIECSVAALGLESNVILAGTRSDIGRLLCASDAFLLTSISEGIPLTVIEAMAAERPVVSTSVGGIAEMVEHGRSGFLAPAGDFEGLASHLLNLASGSDLRQSTGRAGSQIATRKFSQNAMMNSYRQVYRELISIRKPQINRAVDNGVNT